MDASASADNETRIEKEMDDIKAMPSPPNLHVQCSARYFMSVCLDANSQSLPTKSGDPKTMWTPFWHWGKDVRYYADKHTEKMSRWPKAQLEQAWHSFNAHGNDVGPTGSITVCVIGRLLTFWISGTKKNKHIVVRLNNAFQTPSA